MRIVQAESQTRARVVVGREIFRWVFTFGIALAAIVAGAVLTSIYPGPAGFDPASLVGP